LHNLKAKLELIWTTFHINLAIPTNNYNLFVLQCLASTPRKSKKFKRPSNMKKVTGVKFIYAVPAHTKHTVASKAIK